MLLKTFNNYSMSACWIRDGKKLEARSADLAITSLVSKKREWNNCCIKDVRANCYCASLQRTQIHMPRHASSARAKY